MKERDVNNGAADRIRELLVELPRSVKQIVSAGADFGGILLCAFATGWLLSGSVTTESALSLVYSATAVIALAIAWALGMYRSLVRYMGNDLFIAAAKISAAATLAGTGLISIFATVPPPLRWSVAFFGLSFIYMAGSRVLGRVLLVKRRSEREREPVIIYGAGKAGAQLANGLQGGDEFYPVGLVDNDIALHNKTIKGLVVYAPDQIASLIDKYDAKRVLLAIPSASRRKRRAVIEYLSDFPVHVQTMPGLADLVSGKARVDDIREVEVKDILGRNPVPPNPKLLGASITGRNVMVTGAGGSIGSELCRQIIQLSPKSLVLFEISEYGLYAIEKELRATTLDEGVTPCEIIPLLGSVHHKARIQEVLETFEISTVYHAAAYKHVPVVEHNILEGVHNNVVGTLHLAQAAIAANVDSFVLISTDKAVSPTNVMGATKRFAELILQALQDQFSDTCFCMVRFGNVLESSGSVVPLFREQIRSGGPVTVTHRDIIRYFMTIPEAAQLVVQAAAMAKGGDVFVLDMGEPVRILDLAHRMIRLMGLTVRDKDNPDGDIEIQFTGLRPAEKLYEELLIGTDVTGTDHPRILRANEEMIHYSQLSGVLDQLNEATLSLDRKRTREILMSVVHGYKPSDGIADLVWINQQKTGTADASTVVEFPTPGS